MFPGYSGNDTSIWEYNTNISDVVETPSILSTTVE
jgi:hypothetical protein